MLYMELSPPRYKIRKLQQLFLKKGKYLEKKKVLVNLSHMMLKFLELKEFFENPFPKRLISILSIYLHHSGGYIRQIKRQI